MQLLSCRMRRRVGGLSDSDSSRNLSSNQRDGGSNGIILPWGHHAGADPYSLGGFTRSPGCVKTREDRCRDFGCNISALCAYEAQYSCSCTCETCFGHKCSKISAPHKSNRMTSGCVYVSSTLWGFLVFTLDTRCENTAT